MALPHHLHLDIPSQFDELERIDRLMEALLASLGCDEDERSRLALSVREAVANAMLHGNQLDSEKQVTLRTSFDEAELVIEVADEGSGFDLDALPDPLAPENLLKPTGRGILLMRNFMDEVTFEFPEAGGTLVSMRKSLAAREKTITTEDDGK